MRNTIVVIGLALLMPVALAGQGLAQRHTFVPEHKQRLSVDFGMKRAMRSFPVRPVPCVGLTKKHSQGLLAPRSDFIEMPIYPQHTLRRTPAPPCPVR